MKQIIGAEERASRLMQEGRAQPDDAIYEMLIAGAYRQRGWQQVSFVPETPGLRKQPDIFVKRGRSEWAVECKRAGRSGYARDEKLAGERMSAAAHEISRQAARPLVIMVHFRAELAGLGDNYLAEKAVAFTGGSSHFSWADEGGTGVVVEVPWHALRQVLRTDDIYFGGSRMIELVLGNYNHSVDYNMAGDWSPAEGRPCTPHLYIISA
ncbi:hypothetical protein P6U16_27560 (plasmid) [Rhizobium sp. 32-5/1]|uniref:hypothetical protein n=1 Tax=Rhizobium sp. 32-5/1 TaxID=3019602 RepID=UPI00240D5E63|nr:hypothetical protein [Rhizobium sp. 32-5/1]WEZ86306.1 hypothetical protein P6U16_27560 [Rhizobium sp. 32-5/1]